MRSLSDIYNEAVSYRDQYLELKEMRNGSKMFIIMILFFADSSTCSGLSGG